ncbi:MAG: tRNA 2-thiouridine(34) synthase MnmA [Phycisphaerales bacterium]|jgi:tRNA-specific 2-thiouridylase|nr:tRNA 2-thiouridine(34) synthase MnmA [Phycisphaerales bacterium]
MAKVLMAMSGGVDSSVAAALLQQEGHEVIGCFMRLGAIGEHVSEVEIQQKGCCSINDAHDARHVCAKLGVTFYALDFKEEFGRIIDYFVDEYNVGRTPNPCIRCNDWLKFGRLHQYAKTIGAEYVASGHHAQVLHTQNGSELHRGADESKDQSYVLFGATRDRLSEMLLPIGHLQKDAVRTLAREFDLPVANKPDSQDICFVPDNNYAKIIESRAPNSLKEGQVFDTEGNIVGTHQGHQKYTIGQRRGLGIAMSKPVYVVAKDPVLNSVTIGGEEQLNCHKVLAKQVNWLIDEPQGWVPCTAKIRYNTPASSAKVRIVEQGIEVVFDAPQRGGATGQAVVCYQESRVICGGWIEEVS